MATHQKYSDLDETYFITFTCYEWLNLFEITKLYSYFEKWFDYLNSKNALLLSYVIMPNHFHGVIHLNSDCDISLNKLVGNGKRFLAYEIVSRLKKNGNSELLNRLCKGVQTNEKSKNKQHQIFRLSFDAKACYSLEMMEQKIDYIHHNPVAGKWELVNDWTDYPYSSAAYYELGLENKWITDYRDVF